MLSLSLPLWEEQLDLEVPDEDELIRCNPSLEPFDFNDNLAKLPG